MTRWTFFTCFVLALDGTYDGAAGPIRWTVYDPSGTDAGVDLKAQFDPDQNVCGYGLCYVVSSQEKEVQIRIGANDMGKVWVGGQLVYEYPHEGGMELDRAIVPVTLPAGTTPILVKACNGEGDWGFVFRVTDPGGKPVENLEFSFEP